MATRNLTKVFIEIRNAERATRRRNAGTTEEEEAILKRGKEVQSIDPNSLLWVQKLGVVDEDIKKIATKMRELSQLRTKRLMVNFETDEAQQEAEIDRCTVDITKTFRHAESILKGFGKMDDDASSSELVRKNSVRSAAIKLQGLSTTFRSSQRDYMARLNQRTGGEASKRFNFLDDDGPSPRGGAATEVDYGFNSTQLQVLENTEQLVNSRGEDIVKIAKNVEELAQIFKDLAALVIEQGTILDRIDYNMEIALDHTKKGMKEMTQAETYQKEEKSRATKCIGFLVLCIFIMVMVIVIKHMPSSQKK